MSLALLIRRHIFRLPEGKLFTSRDLLGYAPRSTVDRTMYILVKKGIVVRVARGVFMRETADGWRPSIEEVVKVKAEAFGRTVHMHPKTAAKKMRLTEVKDDNPRYWSSGASSSFIVGSVRVFLHVASRRKLNLADDLVGIFLKSLLFFGKREYSDERRFKAQQMIMTREDRQILRLELLHTPEWLRSNFTWYRTALGKSRSRKKA